MNPRRTNDALSLDLVGSRTLPRRPAYARRLAVALSRLRRQYRAAWAAPLVSAHGIDELSGVFLRPHAAIDILLTLNHAVAPARCRMGLGVGRIDVVMRRGDAAGMDATAFLHAALAVRRARELRLPFAIDTSRRSVRAVTRLESLAAKCGIPGDPAADLARARAASLLARLDPRPARVRPRSRGGAP